MDQNNQAHKSATVDLTIGKIAEKQFKAIVEASPDCLLMINKQEQIILANNMAEKLFGYAKEQLIGKNLNLLIPDRFKLKHKGHIKQYFKDPHVRPMGAGLELYGLHQDGHEFSVEISLSPLTSAGNLLALAAVRDVTERKKIENSREMLAAELHAKNIELANANLIKDRFLSSMSHELRTPLNAIIGFTGTLLMQLPGPLNADQEKQLRTVEGSAKHLLSIINDILDLAKIESGKIELNLTEVNCHELVNEILTTFMPLVKAQALELKSDLPAADILIITDRRSLTQILINLLNNAIKFTQKGYIKVSMEQIKEQKFVVIKIIDTGIGIKDSEQDKLFKAFVQLEQPEQYFSGTGLGLYISKKLANLINAKIEFVSKYGEGSCFSVILPKISKKTYD